MWAMLPALVCNSRGGGTSYRPSTSSGIVTNPALAYDLPGGLPETYPYKTAATRSQTGSAVSGTPDNISATWFGFPTLAKETIGALVLKLGLDLSITGVGTTSIGLATAGQKIEMSYDGGATWLDLLELGTNIQLLGGASIYINYPAVIYNDANFWRAVPTSFTQTTYQYPLNPILLTTGLQDLRLRYTVSTIKNATWASQSSYGLYDIVAVIS